MVPRMKPLLSLALLAFLTGCGTYRHERPTILSVEIEPGKTNLLVATELTSVRVFFQKLDATKIRSTIRDGAYSRTVSLGGVGMTGDAEFIKAIAEGVAEGFVKSQTGGLGIPNLQTLPGLPATQLP